MLLAVPVSAAGAAAFGFSANVCVTDPVGVFAATGIPGVGDDFATVGVFAAVSVSVTVGVFVAVGVFTAVGISVAGPCAIGVPDTGDDVATVGVPVSLTVESTTFNAGCGAV